VYHAIVEVAGVRGLRVAHAALVGLLLLLYYGMLRAAGVPRRWPSSVYSPGR